MAYAIDAIMNELNNHQMELINNLDEYASLNTNFDYVIIAINAKKTSITIKNYLDSTYYYNYATHYYIQNLFLDKIMNIILQILTNDYLNKINNIETNNFLIVTYCKTSVQVVLADTNYVKSYCCKKRTVNFIPELLLDFIIEKAEESKWITILYEL